MSNDDDQTITPRKLTLHRETVRGLTVDQLGEVQGGKSLWCTSLTLYSNCGQATCACPTAPVTTKV